MHSVLIRVDVYPPPKITNKKVPKLKESFAGLVLLVPMMLAHHSTLGLNKGRSQARHIGLSIPPSPWHSRLCPLASKPGVYAILKDL